MGSQNKWYTAVEFTVNPMVNCRGGGGEPKDIIDRFFNLEKMH